MTATQMLNQMSQSLKAEVPSSGARYVVSEAGHEFDSYDTKAEALAKAEMLVEDNRGRHHLRHFRHEVRVTAQWFDEEYQVAQAVTIYRSK